MEVYHGSSEIVKKPEIRIEKYGKDFYYGFYCTVYETQADRETHMIMTLWKDQWQMILSIIMCRVFLMVSIHEKSFGVWQDLRSQLIRLVSIRRQH